MKHNKTPILISLFVSSCVIGLIGCSSPSYYESRIFEDLFSLDVENTMVNIGDHDPYASTEYGNSFKEYYFKVIHASIDTYKGQNNLQELNRNELFNHYVLATESRYAAHMASLIWISKLDTLVNAMPCTVHEVNTVGSGFPIRYKIAYFVSESRLYQLHIWVIEKRINKFNEGMNQMIYSFREI